MDSHMVEFQERLLGEKLVFLFFFELAMVVVLIAHEYQLRL